jgi:6-pyruvoyltetrahydropterin/6-carboxytetrahydropterin synthase
LVGHQGRCRFLHGHSTTITFELVGTAFELVDTEGFCLNALGMVKDFEDIKNTLCKWIDENWDHKMLLWTEDSFECTEEGFMGIVRVPFNPTAENMALHLLRYVGPQVLPLDVRLISVKLQETGKCFVKASL